MCLHAVCAVSGVRTVKFHPHGSVIAAASADNSIKLWDVRSRQLLQHYAAHDAAVNAIDFHPSGDFLISASDDTALKVQSYCNCSAV